jgi:release factor glutamine methyltransferase
LTTFRHRSCYFGPLLIRYDERVLTPRPWTVQQSYWAADICAEAEPGPLLELCAGVGHIGLLSAVLADRNLVQVEADPIAATYARSNAALAGWSHRTEVRNTYLQKALQPDERFVVAIADPPYLRTADIGRWPDDPPMAIDGGADGLDLVTGCLCLAARHLTEAGQLLLQVAGPAQDEQVAELLDASPSWGLTRRDAHVIDKKRAILLIDRAAE